MTFAFEKLLVYQKAVDFADEICQLTEQFPSRHGHLSDQLNRASLSISSNIAEDFFSSLPLRFKISWYSKRTDARNLLFLRAHSVAHRCTN